MKAIVSLAAIALPLVVAVAPAMSFSGTYTVTFYNGPSHTETGTECVTFTSTNNIDGFPDSGTWKSSTLSGWKGNYIHDGHYLRWYGTANSGATVTNFYNKIGKSGPKRGGFDEWNVSGIVAQLDGVTTIASGCAPESRHAHAKNPARN